MKYRFLFCCFLLACGCLPAQVNVYLFSSSIVTYTPVTGGAVLGGPANDEQTFPGLDIGFPFCFNGQTYTSFGVAVNGFLSMGPGSLATTVSPISSGSANLISGFGSDLKAYLNSELRYVTLGTAPNRELVVQWSNYSEYVTGNDTLNFQVRLHETSNIIDVVYGHFVANTVTQVAQVGLRGNTGTDYNNRRIDVGVHTWITSIAGTANSNICNINSTLLPPSGLKYSWTHATTPAAPTSMSFTTVNYTTTTVRWNDNSTTEQSFALLRSTDNVNFTFVASVNSTTVATTGTQYLFAQTDLFAGTLYYYRVMAVSNTGSAFLTGQQATPSGTMCGTYSVGPTGNYASLGAAFSALNTNGLSCGVILELQPSYVCTVETFPLSVPALPASANYPVTVRPALGATGLLISSGVSQTILLNGTDYLRIDGRPGSVGNSSELTIANTWNNGVALQLQNGAQFNRFSYLDFAGVNTNGVLAPSGVVFFGVANTTSGNSGNTFEYCDFSRGASSPVRLFVVEGTGGAVSRLDTIANCNFHDWHTATGFNYGLYLGTLCSDWVISGNSFYQNDSVMASTSSGLMAIAVNSTTYGSGHKLIGNYIGGSGPYCSVATNSGRPKSWGGYFNAIYVYAATGRTPCLIRDNLITNMNVGEAYTSGNDPYFNGIIIAAGDATILHNTIGSPTDTARIIARRGGGTIVSAIGINLPTAYGTVLVDSNSIGGMYSLATTNGTGAVYGILVASNSGSFVIRHNLIGSTTCANSISNNPSSGNNVAGSLVRGISTGAAAGVYCELTNNIIANLSNRGQGTAQIQTIGIQISTGTNVVRNNEIYKLSSAGGQVSGAQLCSQMGICINNNNSTPQDISNNRIYSLYNTALSGTPMQIGIYCHLLDGPAHVVDGNYIADLTSPAGTCNNTGITSNGGTVTFENNMIVLGVDLNGNPQTRPEPYVGFYKYSASSVHVYHNSVRISGTVNSPTAGASYAFLRAQAGTDVVMNNIFENTRADVNTSSFHTAVVLTDLTTLTLDYNNYFISPGNAIGRISSGYATLPAWQTATGMEAHALNEDPHFISQTDLHISTSFPSLLESMANPSPVNHDYDHDQRPGPVPSVNGGGIGPDIGADEFDGFMAGPDVTLLSVSSPVAGCHTGPQTVTVLLKNTGNVLIDFTQRPVTVSGNVTGPNPQSFTPIVLNTGTLAVNAQLVLTFSTTYSMSAAGAYVFQFSATMNGDLIAANNSTSTSLLVGGGTVSLANAPVCAGDTFLLTATNYTTGGTLQWQSSPDGMTWTNVSGAQNDSLRTAASDTTYYRLFVCGSTASAAVVVNTGPVAPPLTLNASVCDSGMVTLQASGNGSINWYSQSSGGNVLFTGTSLTVFVNAPLTYYAEVAQGACSSTRTPATVSVFASPLVALGNDTTVCGSILLNAGNAGSSFLWSNGSTAQTTTANTNGDWSVRVTNTNGCSSSDTIHIQTSPLPVVALGNDTAVCGALVLDAGNAGSSFLWNNGSTGQTLLAATSGNWWVSVTNINGCSNADTIHIQSNSFPLVQLGNDTTVCGGIVLDAGHPGSSFLWNNGSQSQTLPVNASNNWSVRVTDVNGCSGVDTIQVLVNPLPGVQLSLPFDTVCENGGALALNGGTPAGGSWSGPGVSGSSFDPQLAGPGAAFIFYTYTNANSCSASDSALVSVDVCMGLEANMNAALAIMPNPFTDACIVTLPGTYTLRVLAASGKLMREETLPAGTQRIDTPGWPAGIYFVQLVSESGQSFTQRLVKLGE